jgi:hypothetical protein
MSSWTNIRSLVVPAALGAAVTLVFGGASDHVVAAPAAQVLTSTMPSKIANRQMQPLSDGPRRGVQLDAHEGDGLAWWPESSFGDGTIELDLRGKDVLQQSFLGVAFHGVDEKTFDDVYFRPFNFAAADPARKAHSVQYESHPGFTWDILRADHPDQYERAISTPPDPNGWFHVRLVVASPVVRVFVDQIAVPVMEVTQLSHRKTGWVGVWVGNNSDGQFANVRVTPAR